MEYVPVDFNVICPSKSKDNDIIMQFPLSFNWNQSNEFCQRLGGRLNLATNQRSLNRTFSMIRNGEVVNSARCLRTWMGASDSIEEGIWRDSVSGEKLNISSFWFQGQPNGNRRQNCASAWEMVKLHIIL